MNVTDFTHLLNKPDSINTEQTNALKLILDDFPYFQSARALRLKGLYNENSFRYNYALKVTAAYTADRSVLFDFISSKSFIGIENQLFEMQKDALHNIEVVGVEQFQSSNNKTDLSKKQDETSKLEQSIKESINQTITKDTPVISSSLEEKLEIGTPIPFASNEKHSFQEWLQLSKQEPIVRYQDIENQNDNLYKEKKKKTALIDKFIENNPKIPAVKSGVPMAQIDINKEENPYLMTETLAKVYLEQKKYQKAIQAYQILILKYPEKSSLFANRISDIKILQQKQ